MLQRCLNPENAAYKRYGGRGITVCRRWLKFENFLADMGDRPVGLTLDRKHNDKGYSKNNCHWASYRTQANNTRRNRFLTFQGRTRTRAQWRRELGFSASTLANRLDRDGWTIERALSTPVKKNI